MKVVPKALGLVSVLDSEMVVPMDIGLVENSVVEWAMLLVDHWAAVLVD